MIRHGRLRTLANRSKIPNFDDQLNFHIKKLEESLPESWAFILDYVDCEANLPTRFMGANCSSEHLAKETFKSYGKAQIFYRLARLKEQKEEN